MREYVSTEGKKRYYFQPKSQKVSIARGRVRARTYICIKYYKNLNVGHLKKLINDSDKEKILEPRLRKLVKDKLKGRAVKFWPITERGYPDRLVLLPGGRAKWVEVKTKGKDPTPIQKLRHKELRELGFEVWLVDTEERLQEFLKSCEV